MSRRFNGDCAGLLEANAQKNPVYLVNDDASRLDVLRKLLGRRALDSASLAFFAKNPQDVWFHKDGLNFPVAPEIPARLQFPLQMRSAQIDLETQRIIYGVLSRLMPSSALLTVTREGGIHKEDLPTNKDDVVNIVTDLAVRSEENMAGDSFRYWDPVGIFASDSYQKPEGAVGSSVFRDGVLMHIDPQKDEIEYRVYALCLQRNKVPFK